MLDREVDDRAADLNSLVETWQERCTLFDEDKCAKLALVVFKEELSSFKLDFGMAARHRDIIDT